MLYIIIAILMFGVLIAVHELGHFLVAKALGVRVNEFSIGMGPLLLKKQGRETLYSLRLLPVGGYCAMEGEDEDSDDPRAFGNAAGWKRFLILIAGSFMNFLAGVVILLGLMAGTLGYYTAGTTLDSFAEGFPSQGEELLLPGDQIVEINGARVWLNSDVTLLLGRSQADSVDLVIRRDGRLLERSGLDLTPREYDNGDGTVSYRYGLNFALEKVTPLVWLRNSLYNSLDFVRLVHFSLVDLISGQAGLKDLSGPIGIVDAIGQVGEQSANWIAALQNILYFSAFIAINLAVMNLLPLPALDGGRVFFLVINALFRAVTRRKLDPKYEGYVHMAGLVLLLGLMVVVAFNDIVRIAAR